MRKIDILKQRLLNQHILGSQFEKPDDMVRWMGAVQVQDFLGSLWAIGMRVKNARDIDIERAIADKTIVRTWLLRGTLHFVAVGDIKWILDLVSPRIIARNEQFLKRNFNLDNKEFKRIKEVIKDTLEGGHQLTRNKIYQELEKVGISTAGLRGVQILHRLALEGLICFGVREGKQQTVVLLDEWIPKTRNIDQNNALGELALRYFTSHGPASIKDFRWWSGLKDADARTALDMIKSQLESEQIDGQTYWFSSIKPIVEDVSPVSHLLPNYDEYVIGYKSRNQQVNGINTKGSNINDYIFNPKVIVNGKIVGAWKRIITKGKVIFPLIITDY
jgi:Winged helix DNA-binding domain